MYPCSTVRLVVVAVLTLLLALLPYRGRSAVEMSAPALLKAVTISPAAKHTATVIFVHGLGDSGHGWKPVGDVRLHHSRCVCRAHATSRCSVEIRRSRT
jgi:pimeloyl-ACP methyl ester carboxylesterase